MMPFQKGNTFGGSHKGHPCYNREKLRDSRWIQKNGKTKRIATKKVERYLAKGWTLGRPQLSEETRKKQSESAKNAVNAAQWKPGQVPWNLGIKMPLSHRLKVSMRQLSHYGVTQQEIEKAWATGMRWCSEHHVFEPEAAFAVLEGPKRSTRCKLSHKKYSPWYARQLAKQNGGCALCGGQQSNGKGFCVDHDHNCPNPRHTRKHDPLLGCECSRGLLCHNCNIRIEEMENFITQGSGYIPLPGTWAEKALTYLASYKPLTAAIESRQESQ